MNSLDGKLETARRLLRETGGVAVAFSGGTDSTLVAFLAHEQLGDRALAVTALSPTYPGREQREAAEMAARIGIRHETVVSNELEIPGFAENPPNRCYFCKRELIVAVRQAAQRHGIRAVADGSNADDVNDYRPGLTALAEAGAISPLRQAGLTKAEVRALSRRFGLPTADKPALACLASRFPYGTTITAERLQQVDALEEALRSWGFRQVRVRYHGAVARIEVEPEAVPRLAAPEMRARVVKAARDAGFLYVAADLEGYRTGSLNEALHAGLRGTTSGPGAPDGQSSPSASSSSTSRSLR